MSETIKELLQASVADLSLELNRAELEKFAVFAAELIKWNRKINLTAITSPRDIVLKHFLDSLVLLKAIGPTGKLLDIGSGGGFPSIPLKLVLPNLAIVSVDAVEKKIRFQRHAARTLQLEGFSAIHARCEDLQDNYAGFFDWIVSRAFSDLPTFAALALPMLQKNGRIIAMKGKRGREEAAAAASTLGETGLAVDDVVECRLPVTGELRTLVVLKKIDG